MIEWLKMLLEQEGYDVRTAMIGHARRGDLQDSGAPTRWSPT
jgi:hypothetical protein